MGTSKIHIRRDSDSFEVRRSRIFTEILNLYIQTASPVGSRTIARRLRNSLSPATIRNVMADLEEMGYIGHPHTSAGRVPTEEGYRYYVNALMEGFCLTHEEDEAFRGVYQKRCTEIEEMVLRASRILSEYSNQAALVFYSGLSRDLFKKIALIPLEERSKRLLVVFVSASGLVRNYKVELGEPMDDVVLQRLSGILNQELQGFPLSQIASYLKRKIMMERDSLIYNLLRAGLEIVKATLLTATEEHLWMEGASRVLEQPEFHDIQKAKALLRLLEERDALLQLLRQDLDQDVKYHIYIGSEMGSEAMRWYSLVTCRYKVGDRVLGTVGILGPTRMEYPKVVALVDRMAQLLGAAIAQMGQL